MSTIKSSTTLTTAYSVEADTTGTLVFQTGATPTTAVTIDTSQNVGIGNTTVRNKLDVVGNTGIYSTGATSVGSPLGAQVYIGDSNYNTASYYNAAPGFGAVYDATYASAAALAFYTYAGTPNARSERMRIDSSGNMGIGTSSPAQKLHVQGAGNTYLKIQDTQANGYNAATLYANDQRTFRLGVLGTAGGFTNGALVVYDETAAAWRMVIDSSGNLLVGTTSNSLSTKVFVSGSIGAQQTYGPMFVSNENNTDNVGRSSFNFQRGGTLVGQIVTTNSTCAYNSVSDYRLKENIAPMIGALGKVAQLKPCTFTWKSNSFIGQGFIAHELQAVVPDCVVGEKDAVDAEGNPVYQGVDTSFLVATLTAAIQEQQALIQQLQADVAALKGTS